MTKYGIYTELGCLELVCIIEAENYEEARKKAKCLGYGKEYRVEVLEV